MNKYRLAFEGGHSIDIESELVIEELYKKLNDINFITDKTGEALFVTSKLIVIIDIKKAIERENKGAKLEEDK
jgi:predicted AAA+ superfamily ATPase